MIISRVIMTLVSFGRHQCHDHGLRRQQA